MTSVPAAARQGEGVPDRFAALLLEDLDAGFAEVVRAHQRLVHSTVARAGQRPADTEDLAADVFLRAYRALRSYDPERIAGLRLRPWLVTIALNSSRNRARDQSRKPLHVPLERAPDQSDGRDAFDGLVDRMDRNRVLAGLLAELPEQQRVAIVLRHVCELSVGETAQVLGCAEGTVKSLVSRGLRKLRDGGGTAARPLAATTGRGKAGRGTGGGST
jgi:RNA polymerase sigma-70 factor (ECF subfamily)